jgi:16S rRNA G527 N7-methylase RsmG
LVNVEVHATRAEKVHSDGAPVDVVVSRAVRSTDAILPVADRWVRHGGLALCMRGAGHTPAGNEDARWRLEGHLTYRVGTERTRRIDVYRKSEGPCFT